MLRRTLRLRPRRGLGDDHLQHRAGDGQVEPDHRADASAPGAGGVQHPVGNDQALAGVHAPGIALARDRPDLRTAQQRGAVAARGLPARQGRAVRSGRSDGSRCRCGVPSRPWRAAMPCHPAWRQPSARPRGRCRGMRRPLWRSPATARWTGAAAAGCAQRGRHPPAFHRSRNRRTGAGRAGCRHWRWRPSRPRRAPPRSPRRRLWQGSRRPPSRSSRRRSPGCRCVARPFRPAPPASGAGSAWAAPAGEHRTRLPRTSGPPQVQGEPAGGVPRNWSHPTCRGRDARWWRQRICPGSAPSPPASPS